MNRIFRITVGAALAALAIASIAVASVPTHGDAARAPEGANISDRPLPHPHPALRHDPHATPPPHGGAVGPANGDGLAGSALAFRVPSENRSPWRTVLVATFGGAALAAMIAGAATLLRRRRRPRVAVH